MKLDVLLTVVALALSACGLSTGPNDSPNPEDNEIELGIGDEYSVPGTVFRVGFHGIEEDSRCPVDVVCVWEGNAAAALGLTAGTGPTHLRVLNTALEPQSTDFERLRVTLIAVSPEPREGEAIPPESYVVRLRLDVLSG